jgi:hypothetical protein
MAIGSGLGSQVGIAAESTYGTRVASTSFLRANKVGLKKVKNSDQSSAITAGGLVDEDAGHVLTTRAASGSIDVDISNRKLGLLVQSLMGTSVTPTLLTGTAYQQTHTLADTIGKSLSIQVGIPEVGGTVRPYSFSGCKVTAATFEIETAKIGSATFEFDAQDVSEAPSLDAASFPTGMVPLTGTQTTVKLGAFGSEAAVTGVKKVSIKIDRALDEDRFYIGGAGLKAEPVLNAKSSITGTISADYLDKTVFADRFASDAAFSLVVEVKGALIGGTNYETFRITLPCCRLDGDTQTIDGPGIVSGDFPFTYRYDGTNQAKIEIISTESTLG